METSIISNSDENTVINFKPNKNIYIAETSSSDSSGISTAAIPLTSTAENQITDGLTRKRKTDPKSWMRNSQKILRMSGKEYTNRSGNKIRARAVRDINCKCHYKCTSKINISQRQQMLLDYLSLDTERSRWAFIGSNVLRMPVKRRYQGDSNKRQHTLKYTVISKDEIIQV